MERILILDNNQVYIREMDTGETQTIQEGRGKYAKITKYNDKYYILAKNSNYYDSIEIFDSYFNFVDSVKFTSEINDFLIL